MGRMQAGYNTDISCVKPVAIILTVAFAIVKQGLKELQKCKYYDYNPGKGEMRSIITNLNLI
jgi:hypothetical protein